MCNYGRPWKAPSFNQYHSFLLPFLTASPATETVHNQKVAMPILAFHLVLYNVIAIPANILLFTHSPWSIHQEQSLHVSLVLYCVLVTYLILDSNIIVFTIQFVLYLICLVEIN